EQYCSWNFELTKLTRDEATDCGLIQGTIVSEHDGRADILAEGRVPDAKGGGLSNLWMRSEDIIHFLRNDLLTASIDFFLYSAFEKQITVVIEITGIACVKPAVAE